MIPDCYKLDISNLVRADISILGGQHIQWGLTARDLDGIQLKLLFAMSGLKW